MLPLSRASLPSVLHCVITVVNVTVRLILMFLPESSILTVDWVGQGDIVTGVSSARLAPQPVGSIPFTVNTWKLSERLSSDGILLHPI